MVVTHIPSFINPVDNVKTQRLPQVDSAKFESLPFSLIEGQSRVIDDMYGWGQRAMNS